MSKDKKTAYAEKQRMAVVTSDARSLTPITASGPSAGPAKKAKGKKQSRGK
ncbi:MAG: hypothetical protein K0Q72_3845 [Armatimonadetes bacterium]|jgi:hypothetical protein|nr:hypothetical protein [Armatimonadota bacterium]